MTRERVLNLIGFSLLIVCFALSVARIVSAKWFTKTSSGENIITIRLAHWQLEAGVREAFEAIGREYEAKHPNVRVRSIPIPERIYLNWLRTQVVGGTAPDIVEIGQGITSDMLARYFVPLGDVINKPNPHNVSTSLADTPLRETFFDGMQGGFNSDLLEYFGVPVSIVTVRIFYNLDLLKKITGNESIPATYEEFVALCEKVKDYSLRTGMPIVPIAGSKYNGPMLMDRLFSSQTQRLTADFNTTGEGGAGSGRIIERYFAGKWQTTSPEIESGFALAREVGGYMQPGFMQLQRDDATFMFLQARSLMICTGSWDVTSIAQQAAFPLGIGPIPLPTKDHPRYGRYVKGFVSEAGSNASLPFGLTKSSKHPEIALDFLLFLGSKAMAKVFTDVSGWLPAIVGVESSPRSKGFALETAGFSGGFVLGNLGPDTRRVLDTNFYRLIDPSSSSKEFLEMLNLEFAKTFVSDQKRATRSRWENIIRSDSLLGASAWLAGGHISESTDSPTDEDRFLHASTINDRAYYSDRLVLDQIKKAQ